MRRAIIRIVELRVLGPLEIVEDGRVVAVAARKQRALLACLLLTPNDVVSTDRLVDGLWGDAPPPSAAKLVQVYVSRIRRTLGRATILTRPPGYAIAVGPDAIDAPRFERLLAAGRAAARDGNPELAASLLRRALGLWRGQAYGDLASEEFLRPEAERLEELRLLAIEERIDAELALGRHVELLPEILSLARAEPLRERVHGQAMLALYRCGRQSEALDAYRGLRRRLRDELGLEPDESLRELERRVLQHDPGLTPSRTSDAAAIGSLPAPAGPLLGRERELRELAELVRRDDVRLLVLTGAGGSGKTRLGIETARESAGDFANGVVYVELAPLRGSGTLLSAIAEAFGIQERDDDNEAIVAAIGSREVLLVLDNAEHLRSDAPAIAHLVGRAPRLTVLVTSRVVLHLSGEHVYPVAPLRLEAAVELFGARARGADASFEVGRDEAEVLRRICERLDGLPLAIELAATRARTLSPAQLLARLDARLPILTSGPRDLPARQRTLRATIEWSFELLESERERELLASLSVFAGGCTLDAVEKVCEAELEDVAALVDASLVQRGGERYSVLETIREFAAERLELAGNGTDVRRRHAAYYAAFAETFGLHPEAIEKGRIERYDHALADAANLRVALDWARANDPRLGLALAMALEQHWVSHNPAEGKRYLEALLAAVVELPPEVRARALRCLGGSNDILGDLDAAVPLYEESLAIYTTLGDEWGMIHLRHRLGLSAVQRGEFARACELFEENLLRARAGGFRFLEAEALGGLGWVAGQEGDFESARRLTQGHVEVVREVGWPWGEAMGLIYLADISLSLGRLDECETAGRTGLELARRLEDRVNIVRSLALLAARAGVAGDTDRAGRLWGAIEAEEARGPIGRGETHRAHVERALGPGGEALERALEAGRHLSLREAVDLALVGRDD